MAQSKRGRPKGSTNKITNLAKWAIQRAFDKLGGVDALVEWVKADKANRTAFYTKIYPKLLPRPAADVANEPEQLAPVRGALIWQKPTPSPYRPLVASTSAPAVAGATESVGPREKEEQAAGQPSRNESG